MGNSHDALHCLLNQLKYQCILAILGSASCYSSGETCGMNQQFNTRALNYNKTTTIDGGQYSLKCYLTTVWFMFCVSMSVCFVYLSVYINVTLSDRLGTVSRDVVSFKAGTIVFDRNRGLEVRASVNRTEGPGIEPLLHGG